MSGIPTSPVALGSDAISSHRRGGGRDGDASYRSRRSHRRSRRDTHRSRHSRSHHRSSHRSSRHRDPAALTTSAAAAAAATAPSPSRSEMEAVATGRGFGAGGRAGAGADRVRARALEVKEFIGRQISGRTKKDSDIQRRVSQLFGRPSDGSIALPRFKYFLHKSFGVKLSDEEAAATFALFDVYNAGRITLQQLIKLALPPDFTEVPWNIKRDASARRAEDAKKHNFAELTLKRLPPSLAKVRWTIEKIEKAVQQRVLQRTRRPESQYREAYRMFGNPHNGITPANFKHSLANLGIICSDEEIAALVKRYDKNHNGRVDWGEFCRFVMPKDYAEKSWNIKRDEAMWDTISKKAHGGVPDPVPEWPVSLQQNKMSVAAYVKQIRLKILERTTRPSDQYREAFRLFGSPQNGIPEENFLPLLRRKLGISIDEDMAHKVFCAIDANDSGHIDFNELVRYVMGKDITEKQFYETRALEDEAKAEAKKHAGLSRTLDAWPKSMEKHPMSFENVILLLRTKINERAKRPSDRYREVFKMFGYPQHGISLPALAKKMRSMGIVVTDATVKQMHDYFDINRNGLIDFQEMVKRVMPEDYTGKTWMEVRDREDRKKAEDHLAKIRAEAPVPPPESGRGAFAVPLSTRSVRRPKVSHRGAGRSSRTPSADPIADAAARRAKARERRFPASKLAKWRRPGMRATAGGDPLLKTFPGLQSSASAPTLEPKYRRVNQPVGLSARGIRSGMMRTLYKSGALDAGPRRRPRAGFNRDAPGITPGRADMRAEQKASLHQPPVVPRGGYHVPVMPVFATNAP